MSNDHYIADAPLASREGDRLRRWPFAERIADTLATRSDPTSLVVGVYGRWGEGKTTVLQFIQQRLEEAHADSVVVVRFNPWLFTSDKDLFLGFFAQVAAAIDRQLESTKGKIGGFLKAYGGIVAGLSGVDLSKLGDELAKASPEELRTRLQGALAEKQTRIIVLLDDIDRLDKSEAQAVFRLLKVAADFHWTSYVLAFDPEIIAAALAERYPGRPEGGDEFLDKIVQVPLPLPPAPREVLRTLLYDDINRVLKDSGVELTEGQAQRFMLSFEQGLMPRVETPRAVKRYANALQFALPMLRGEVDTVDLLLIEGMRVFHPRLHAVVAKNREVVLHEAVRGVSKEAIDAFKAAVEKAAGSGTRGSAHIELLVALFPKLEGIYSNVVYDDTHHRSWAAAKRIASPRYFPRYFSSGIPAGDVSNAEIQAALSSARTDPSECARCLTALLDDVEPDTLVQKIIDVAGDAEGDEAIAFARVFMGVGTHLPNPPGAFGDFMTPRGRLAWLTAILLGRGLRGQIGQAADVLENADLAFALHVFRLRPVAANPDPEDEPNIVAEAQWRALGARLLARIQAEAAATWPFSLGREEGAYRISMWREFGDHEELTTYVVEQVDREPAHALDIVRMFTRTGRTLGTGALVQEPIRAEGYERLGALFPPSVLATALEKAYGAPAPEDHDSDLDVETDAELAHSFLRVHHAQQSDDELEGSAPSSEEPDA